MSATQWVWVGYSEQLSDVVKNFTRGASLTRKHWLNWKSFTSGSRFRNILKDSSALQHGTFSAIWRISLEKLSRSLWKFYYLWTRKYLLNSRTHLDLDSRSGPDCFGGFLCSPSAVIGAATVCEKKTLWAFNLISIMNWTCLSWFCRQIQNCRFTYFLGIVQKCFYLLT